MTLRLGAHVSVAGSLLNATEEAVRIGANTIQIFTSSPRMWRASQLNPEQVKAFRAARERLDIQPLAIHDNYLINLASADDEIWLKSGVAMRGELERAIQLDADYLVAHPGSCKGQSIEEGIARLAVGMREAARGLRFGGLTFLWELTAGQGQALGSRVEELVEIRRRTEEVAGIPVGFCVDTAHAFAAGLDLVVILPALGAAHVKLVHANDSKAPFGSRVDRHEHIGKGYIGEEAFRGYLSHPDLRDKAFILETPEDDNGDHAGNLTTLKRLCPKSRITPVKLKSGG